MAHLTRVSVERVPGHTFGVRVTESDPIGTDDGLYYLVRIVNLRATNRLIPFISFHTLAARETSLKDNTQGANREEILITLLKKSKDRRVPGSIPEKTNDLTDNSDKAY